MHDFQFSLNYQRLSIDIEKSAQNSTVPSACN